MVTLKLNSLLLFILSVMCCSEITTPSISLNPPTRVLCLTSTETHGQGGNNTLFQKRKHTKIPFKNK